MKKFFKIIVQAYLKILTRIVLLRHKPFIIAVAGTTNKTFVKETILDELGRDSTVRGNPKSFNTEIGLPLAVLFLPSGLASVFRWVDVLLTGTCVSIFSRKFPRILVLEMGVDRVGDMRYLLSLVKPQIAVLTNIDRSFPDLNTSMDDIFNEFKLLAKSVPEDGALILNGEDARIKTLAASAKTKTILFGKDKSFEATISNLQEEEAGQRFVFKYGKKEKEYSIKRRGDHNIQALVIAKIIAHELENSGIRKNKKKK